MKTILVDAVHTFIIEDQGIFKEMHDLLETFPNRKIILTNADYKKTNQYGIKSFHYAPDKKDLIALKKFLTEYL